MAASVTTQVGIGNSATVATTLETASFTPTGVNKYLYVVVGSGANSPNNPTAVKYASASGVGGESLTLLDSVRTVNINIKTSVWELANPVAASGTIHMTLGGSDNERWIVAVALQDASGHGTITYATGSSSAPSVTATTTAGNLTLDFLSILDGAGPAGGVTITQGGSQTLVKKLDTDTPTGGSANNISEFESSGISRQTAAGASTVMAWSLNRSSDWGIHTFQVNGAVTVSIGSRLQKQLIHPGRHPDRFGRHLRTKRNTIVQISTVTGSLAYTNANDTLAASGSPTVSGSLAKTNANDTLAASGNSTVTGSSATTNANDSISASGSPAVLQGSRRSKPANHPGRGPYNFTHFRKSPRNTAVNNLPTVTGSLAYTNANDTLAASGSPVVSGSLAKTNGNDTLTASGSPTVSGALARNNANDTLAASGTSTVTGSLAKSNNNDTLSASGQVGAGYLAYTNANDTSSGSGSPAVSGSANIINANDTLSASGTPRVSGSLAKSNNNDTSIASGNVGITGSLAYTNANDRLLSSPSGGNFVAIFFDDEMEEDQMQKLIKPVAVTTSDTNPENAIMPDGTSAEYIYVGTAGAVAFVLTDKTTWIAPNVAAGGFLWVPPFRGILAAGTAAVNIFVTRRY